MRFRMLQIANLAKKKLSFSFNAIIRRIFKSSRMTSIKTLFFYGCAVTAHKTFVG